MEFYQTVMGKRFFESTLPRISDNLGRIADALEKKADVRTETIPDINAWPAFADSTSDELLEKALKYSDSGRASDGRLFIDTIINEMASDADSDDRDLIGTYLNADKAARAVMDRLMVDLCGWTFGTVIKKVLGEEKTQGPSTVPY